MARPLPTGADARYNPAVPQAIEYCNTDLDLVSPTDLAPLMAQLKAAGVPPLYPAIRGADGLLWHATFETTAQHQEPENSIADMLDAIEAFSRLLTRQWRAATLREFNIGYQCGFTPWAFNHGLTAQTLRRLADARATLRITLYPPERKPPPRLSKRRGKPSRDG